MKHFLFLLFFSTICFGSEIEITSDEAHYQEQSACLSGHVRLICPFGLLTANNAQFISKTKSFASFLMGEVFLDDAVTWDTPSGDTCICDHASINLESRQGQFEGKEGVHLKVEGRCRATGEKGILSGDQIYLLPGPTIPICHVTSEEGDFVDAKKITFHTTTQVLSLEAPNGQLSPIKAPHLKCPLQFTSNELLFLKKGSVLTLNGQAHLFCPGIGTLDNDQSIVILRSPKTKQLLSICAQGLTTLHCDKGLHSKPCLVECAGKMELDHEKLTLTLETTDSLRQAHYSDPSGEIFADTVTFHYAFDQGQPALSFLVMEGNVFLRQTTSQSIIADKLEYYPQAEEILFSSGSSQKRVLYHDKANDRQLSADKLRITKDPITKKESLQGVGCVRMLFSEEEMLKFKNRYRLP